MENSLKQRIVGAIVLIALAVIFLPSILKEKDKQAPFQTKIPPKPIASIEKKLSEEAIQKNAQTQNSLDQLDKKLKRKTRQASEQPEQKATEKKTEKTTEVKQPVTPQQGSELSAKTQQKEAEIPQTIGKQFKDAAWVIQIASFSNKENAIGFVAKLKKSGHKAYRRQAINSDGKPIFRIFVGPYIKKEGAQKALVEVNKLASMSGIILPFDPIKH